MYLHTVHAAMLLCFQFAAKLGQCTDTCSTVLSSAVREPVDDTAGWESVDDTTILGKLDSRLDSVSQTPDDGKEAN